MFLHRLRAFRDIFPPMTGKRLYEMTVAFKNFMSALGLAKALWTISVEPSEAFSLYSELASKFSKSWKDIS